MTRPTRIATLADLNALDFDKGAGLVTVVAQHVRTGVVLIVAHADREALERTLATGEMHYRSRTRGPWHKGATSGNVQRMMCLLADCDRDAVLALVEPAGPACHTGTESCFGTDLTHDDRTALESLDRVIAARAASDKPIAGSYTRRLLDDRNLRLKKIGEESAEMVLACADRDAKQAIDEAADLTYHMMVALRALGVGLDEVRRALADRARATRPGTDP